MRKFVALMLLAVIISEVSGEHVRYSEALQSDQWLHEFYSGFIDEFAEEIKKAAIGEGCISPVKKLEIVKAEIEFYKARGVDSNASLAIEPFLRFSRALDDFCRASELKEPFALKVMGDSLSEMLSSVDEIEKIVYYNGTTPLYFNTTELREALFELKDFLDFYSEQIKAQEVEGIWVSVSNDEPVLFEDVRIRVYANNVTPLKLFIDDLSFEAKDLTFNFSKLGEHIIYATGLKGDEVVKSNVVRVTVKKIPVQIHLKAESAFVRQSAEVEGYIFDYFGSPLSVPLEVNGFEIEAKNGHFSITIRKDYECSVLVSAFYPGNETHESAVANTTVYFSRYPTWIKLEAEKGRIFEWEKLNLSVKASDELPIRVIVDEKEELSFYGKSHNFSLKLKPGKHVIYAIFDGDELRKPAKSNEVEVVVESLNLLPLALLPLALITALLLSRFSRKFLRPEKAKMVVKKGPEVVNEVETEEIDLAKEKFDDLSEAFVKVFDKLTSKYGLSKALTPRELLKSIEKEEIAGKLAELINLHEKFAYAVQRLSDEEKERFFKLAGEIDSEV